MHHVMASVVNLEEAGTMIRRLAAVETTSHVEVLDADRVDDHNVGTTVDQIAVDLTVEMIQALALRLATAIVIALEKLEVQLGG